MKIDILRNFDRIPSATCRHCRVCCSCSVLQCVAGDLWAIPTCSCWTHTHTQLYFTNRKWLKSVLRQFDQISSATFRAWSHNHIAISSATLIADPPLSPRRFCFLACFNLKGGRKSQFFKKIVFLFFRGGLLVQALWYGQTKKGNPPGGGVLRSACQTKSSLDHVEINRQIVTSKVVICIWSCRTWRRRTWSYCSWSSLNLSACRPTSRRLHLIMATNCQNIVSFVGLFCKRDP